jgi:hypothetical protein
MKIVRNKNKGVACLWANAFDVTKLPKKELRVEDTSYSRYQNVTLVLFLHETDQLLYDFLHVYQQYLTNCYRFVVEIIKNESTDGLNDLGHGGKTKNTGTRPVTTTQVNIHNSTVRDKLRTYIIVKCHAESTNKTCEIITWYDNWRSQITSCRWYRNKHISYKRTKTQAFNLQRCHLIMFYIRHSKHPQFSSSENIYFTKHDAVGHST